MSDLVGCWFSHSKANVKFDFVNSEELKQIEAGYNQSRGLIIHVIGNALTHI